MIRAHQPGSEPIDIPETIPNPVVVPKPTPTPTEPAPKEPVRIPERVPGTARVACSAGRSGQSDRGGRGMERRQSNSLKRSLPRKHVSSICCPVTSSASRLVLLDWPPPDHLWIGTKSRHVLLPQRVTNARASIPAETAAQTRIVSVDRIRLDPWKCVRPFKGTSCHDISEFESYIASQAVGLWPLPSGGSAWCPSARISIPQVITMFYDAACEVHHEHFSRIADRWVRRPKSDLELLDQSRSDGSVSAWVGNGLKTR